MSKKQEHSISLNAELLQKYREGKLSTQEMHRVERILLEDPLYADAMEGIEKIEKNTEMNTHLADLKDRLHQRVSSEQKTIPMYRRTWQIAAAVIVLIIGSWISYNFYFKSTDEQPTEQMLSLKNESSKEKKSAPAPSSDDADNQETLQNQTPEETTSTANAAPKATQGKASYAQEPAEIIDKMEEREEEAPSSPILTETEALPPLASRQPDDEIAEYADEQPTLAISKVPEESYDQTFRSSQMLKSKDAGAEVYGSGSGPYTLTGRVISDEDKSAIPGVNVMLKNTSTGTVTDAHGNFKLSVPTNQDEVVFNSVGFVTREQTISEADSNVTITLTPDLESLSEVVVTGYQGGRSTTETTQAAPLAGYASYRKYLKTNLQYPQTAQENGIEGVVHVSFDVSPYGVPQNFSIKKSLGYGCDEEAIRLIQEGPAWAHATSAGNPITQNITVKVRFSLKD